MPIHATVDVIATDGDGLEVYNNAVRDMIALSASKLDELMTEESRRRADGKGGRDGAVDETTLNTSIGILSKTATSATVGTNLNYAPKLARGLADPSTKISDIAEWAVRKTMGGADLVPLSGGSIRKRAQKVLNHPFVRGVHKKVTTKGPLPNPFDKRAVERFKKIYPDIVREVQFK